jgi:hypothetical protein
MVDPFGAKRMACALAICSVADSPELVLAITEDPKHKDASPMQNPAHVCRPLEQLITTPNENLSVATFSF